MNEDMVSSLSRANEASPIHRSLLSAERSEFDWTLSADRTTRYIDLNSRNVGFMLNKELISVSNGIKAARIVFHGLNLSNSTIRKKAEIALSKAMNLDFRWALKTHWVEEGDQIPTLVLISTRRFNCFPATQANLETSANVLLNSTRLKLPCRDRSLILLSLGLELENRARLVPALPEHIAFLLMKNLRNIAASNSLLCSTLASEILTQLGEPTVPTQAINQSQRRAGTKVDLTSISRHADATFEDRISVDNYAFFELVHPSYFRQTVLLAEMIQRHVGSGPATAIDVGTGPGTNLLAFLEIITDDSRIIAVEPSDVAMHYLQKATRDMDNVVCVQEGFLDLEVEPDSMDYIMSTGASHHFYTDGFLQHSFTLLRPGGYWFIADEMLGKFDSFSQRNQNLLRHHLAYMVPLCFDWPCSTDTRTDFEKKLVSDFNRIVPLATFHAEVGDIYEAEKLCRNLLDRANSLHLSTEISNPMMAFWRLQLLELEAMVAGLDYEVEQKTYPTHLKKMAEGAGFTLIEHKRVHGTIGENNDGAGTHVMVFQKTTSGLEISDDMEE